MNGSRSLALTLTISNADSLDNGSPLTLSLDGRGATIGRAAGNDWSLPDPERFISSRHCEIRFLEDGYELVDCSTNGTYLNGSSERLSQPHRLQDGDAVQIGQYEVVATFAAAKADTSVPPSEPPLTEPPAAEPPPSQAPAAPEEPVLAEAQRNEKWTMFALSNEVDWGRGGFGAAPSAPPSPPAAEAPAPEQSPAAGAVAAEAEEPAGEAAAALDAFLQGAGLSRSQLKQDGSATLAQAGALLRHLVAGLVVMLEARARAKSQMGAQGTGLEIEGNNPLKFARTPEQALQYMLNPRERGFMSAERAVEDGLRDLQAHQLATLRAMQGALRATLDRFSPKAIRARADTRGMLERLLPGSRDAALWKAYEKEFSGVAFDSDEAFMDIFAKEFRQSYDEIARQK